MARLTDSEILAKYKQALAEWAISGAVELDGRAPERSSIDALEGVTVNDFKEALYRFVCIDGGEIDQIKEERDPWCKQWEYHYASP